MSAAQDTTVVPLDDHPAELMARAQELYAESEALYEQCKAKRMEAGRLKARAERLADGEHLRRQRARAVEPDPLLAAATLAAEDLDVFEEQQLGDALSLRNKSRVHLICTQLAEGGAIARVQGGWRSIDPQESRVIEALRNLGTCSREELAAELELAVESLTYYVEELGPAVGWCHVMDDGYLMYLKPEPQHVPRIKRRPPENDPPAGVDAPRRGEPVRLEDHAKRGKAGSRPGERHRLKMRDARREAMDKARAERSERDKAKGNGGKGRKK